LIGVFNSFLERSTTATLGKVLVFVIIIAFCVDAFILHIAASIVVDHARFRQALLASAIIWVVLVAVELMRLPSIIAGAFGLFTNFAGLKIAYGASVPRTVALCFVSGLVAFIGAYILHRLLPA